MVSENTVPGSRIAVEGLKIKNITCTYWQPHFVQWSCAV